MRSKLITSRIYGNHLHDIETYITHDEVGSRINLDDYIEALIEEIGNPTMLVTKGALKSKIETATQAILHDMKLATKHVV